MKLAEAAFMFIFLFVVATGVLIGCVGMADAQGARQVLQDQGYTEIVITGARPFSRGEGDVYSTGFEAVSPAGVHVTGVVTSGYTKGKTIRFD